MPPRRAAFVGLVWKAKVEEYGIDPNPLKNLTGSSVPTEKAIFWESVTRDSHDAVGDNIHNFSP
jgi:hypothetical protein